MVGAGASLEEVKVRTEFSLREGKPNAEVRSVVLPGNP